MKIVNGSVSTGYVGSRRDFEFEVEDSATDEEIDEMVNEEIWNLINIGYTVIEKMK